MSRPVVAAQKSYESLTGIITDLEEAGVRAIAHESSKTAEGQWSRKIVIIPREMKVGLLKAL